MIKNAEETLSIKDDKKRLNLNHLKPKIYLDKQKR